MASIVVGALGTVSCGFDKRTTDEDRIWSASESLFKRRWMLNVT